MISFPFDSRITGYGDDQRPLYDRASNAGQLAEWFHSYFSDGIFPDVGSKLQTLQASDMNVTVAPGNGNIQGRYFAETANRTLALAAADASQPRIDTVVVRLNLNTSARSVDLFVKQGTPASTPAAPALTRNASIWELGIANIRINRGVTAITQSSITDTRLDDARCGIVAQAITTLDTSTYYDQINAALHELQADAESTRQLIESGMQADRTAQAGLFASWFSTVQAVLSGDVAGNLANQIALVQPVSVDATLNALTGSGIHGVWQGDSAPYSQYVDVAGMTATKTVTVGLRPSITMAQYEMAMSARLFAAEIGVGCVLIRAMGMRPTIDIPIRIVMEGA